MNFAPSVDICIANVSTNGNKPFCPTSKHAVARDLGQNGNVIRIYGPKRDTIWLTRLVDVGKSSENPFYITAFRV